MDTHRESDRTIEHGEAAPAMGSAVVAELVNAELSRPQTPVPHADLDLLEQVALGNTGQSRSVRHLLFLLPGAADPTGFRGDGLLELRPLDRALADAFLKVLDWWRGPTRSDQPLYSTLGRIEAAFHPSESSR